MLPTFPPGLLDNFCSHVCLLIITEKTILTFAGQEMRTLDASVLRTGPYNEG